MSSQPYISVRKSIKWEGEEAYEDTDTVVLTSAPRGAPFTSSPDKFFVDIRIYHPKSNEPRLPVDNPGQLPSLARLEWGFAGTSKSKPPTFGDDGKLLKPGHSKWTHVVDNRSLSTISDEGFMYPIEGSDETLEKGSMPHPKTGVDTAYEEIWKDVEILKCAREKTYVSWFAEFIPLNSDDLRRGFLCRIGQYIQGVIRIDNNKVEVVRWKWAGHDQGSWEKELGIGSTMVLNGKLVKPEAHPRRHNKFETLFGGTWQIIQDYYWDDGLEPADLKALNSPETDSKL